MPSPNDCWGIEVGANALKAIRLQRAGKTVAMTDFEIIPYKKVLTTPDIDREEAIRVALNQFTAKKSLDKATVVVSVPGHSAFARFAKLPPVEPKKVPDIVKFEAVQQIPFPIDQVEWDYQTFQDPDSPDVEVGIFAITRERAMNWLANFRAVGIPVHGVSLAPVASYNALAHDQEMGPDSPGTLIMDIGTSATDLIIVEGSRLWLRTIPIGGHHFTEALVRSFKLSYSKAEKIKREAATSKYARQIFQAMRPVFVDLVGEVQKSLGFYQSANRDAEITRVIGLGSTFRLPGIQKFLKQQLQVDVERLQKFEQIEASSKVASQFNDNACSLAPAYGLALQGLEVERVSCNLLPLAIAKRQIWQRKQPWMVAATLMFAASAGIAYSSNIVDKGKFEANEPLRREIQNVISRAESAQRDLRAIEGGPDPRLKIENIRNTQEYRKIWPMILRDVQQALQSSEAQEALISGDAESVAAIPRAQRRLLAVSQI
ncbi:MAG: type IV pilus assembly protein PilM, partial [Phycisphaeraceae bacterium]